MTAAGICVEWIASFIEVTLCNYFMYILSEGQFTRKKQRVMFLTVTAVITTGIILLNLVELSYSMATLLYGIVVLALGGCILYKGNFVEFLLIAINFMIGLVLIEGAIFNTIARIWSPEMVLRIQEGFSLLRICVVIIIKIVEILAALLFGTLIKKIAIKVKKTRLALVGATVAFFSSYGTS